MQVKSTTVVVDEVGPILEVIIAGKTYLKQSLYVTEYVKRPNQFEIELWNSSIAKFNLNAQNLKGYRVRVETYINGRKVFKNGGDVYEKTITLSSIEKLNLQPEIVPELINKPLFLK